MKELVKSKRISTAIFIFQLCLCTFTPSIAAANPTKEECIAFYDERYALAEDEHKQYDETPVKKLEQAGKMEEAWKLALKPHTPLFEISDKAEECGVYDNRFYETQLNLCHSFIHGGKTWTTDARAFYFEKVAKPFFCEKAFARGAKRVLLYYLDYYLRGPKELKDYKKAINEVQRFVKDHPESKEMMTFVVPIYRHGGYGVEKNDKRAFEILKDITEDDPRLACELSLYYRDGIGTEKNIQEADKWLGINEKHYPDKECEYINFDFLFERSGLEKALLKDEIEVE